MLIQIMFFNKTLKSLQLQDLLAELQRENLLQLCEALRSAERMKYQLHYIYGLQAIYDYISVI